MSNNTENGAPTQGGSIFRTNKAEDRYARISNDLLRDSSLSWEARGLMGYLLSMADGWITKNKNLIEQGPAKEWKVRRIVNELIGAGYMHRQKLRKPDGTFVWLTEVYETPDLNPYPSPHLETKSGHHTWKSPHIRTTNKDDVSKNKKTEERLISELEHQANIQELAALVKIDMGGTGDDARRARQLYWQHRDLSLEQIAELAMNGQEGPT